ncbi:DUF3380 domain-containing protein [Burkholderia gladioli]|nr:DUF3380 domain-containing protein [Burkholderia gladioli]
MKAFVAFVKASPALVKAVKDEDFTAFAKGYNGSGYKDNKYDSKMKINFDKFEKADAAKKGTK